MSMEIESNFLEIKQEFLAAARSVELLSEFRKTKNWMSAEMNAKVTQGLLGNHARPYFSPFRAAFLFETKPQSISYFSPFLARDGVLTLLHFFYQHPLPIDPTIRILVQRSLLPLVPKAWRKNVFPYGLVDKTKKEDFDTFKIIFVLSGLGSKQSRMSYIEKQIEAAVSAADGRKMQIQCLSVWSRIEETAPVRDELNRYQNDVLVEIATRTGIRPINRTFKELEMSNLSDWHFCDLNEFNFYYADSYLNHFFYSQGARSFGFHDTFHGEALLQIPLSFNHDLRVDMCQVSESVDDVADQAFADFNSSYLLKSEVLNYKPDQFCFKEKLCSPSFEEFAYSLAAREPNLHQRK
jgi:hypothetical protein